MNIVEQLDILSKNKSYYEYIDILEYEYYKVVNNKEYILYKKLRDNLKEMNIEYSRYVNDKIVQNINCIESTLTNMYDLIGSSLGTDYCDNLVHILNVLKYIYNKNLRDVLCHKSISYMHNNKKYMIDNVYIENNSILVKIINYSGTDIKWVAAKRENIYVNS